MRLIEIIYIYIYSIYIYIICLANRIVLEMPQAYVRPTTLMHMNNNQRMRVDDRRWPVREERLLTAHTLGLNIYGSSTAMISGLTPKIKKKLFFIIMNQY